MQQGADWSRETERELISEAVQELERLGLSRALRGGLRGLRLSEAGDRRAPLELPELELQPYSY